VKTLILLRHAKAVDADDFVAEHDRTLAPRGEKDAVLIGGWLAAQKLIPDRVLCSTAARARRTWELAATALGKTVPTEQLRELYNAGTGSLFETVRRCAEPSETLLVVGHNPGMQALAVALSAPADGDAIADVRAKFPTGALAVIRFEADAWAAVAPGRGTLERFVRPKDLKS
jgi:phosphohistidine phosphatase